MTPRYSTQRDSERCCRHGAISPAGLRQCPARGLPQRRQVAVLKGSPGGKGRRAHRVTGGCRCGRTLFLVLTRVSVPEWRISAQARCDTCPLFERPARALRITRNPLCRWRRPSLTAVAGPPLPPPEPLPDVSTATPFRSASGELTSSCPTCGRVRLSVHIMTAHARRFRPGVIIACEGLPCGCYNGFTVLLTGASRAGRHRSCQSCKQARHAGGTNAGIQYGPGFSSTASSQTPRAADSPTDHGRLRLIHCGNAPLLEIGTVTVCDCLSPHDGILATFVRTALALLTLYCSSKKTNRG
ncbi:mucin TcMUC, partial [Trypanosoma cruzi]